AADDQPREPGPRVRPRLRAEPGAQDRGALRAQQLVRLRRDERRPAHETLRRRGMKIAVCVEQVPDTETRVRVAPSGAAISEADVQTWIVSPYDEFAIEEALRIKEAKGGEVVLLSLGPDRAQSALRSGLAMGADSAIHLKDPLFDQADTSGTAWALASALKP